MAKWHKYTEYVNKAHTNYLTQNQYICMYVCEQRTHTNYSWLHYPLNLPFQALVNSHINTHVFLTSNTDKAKKSSKIYTTKTSILSMEQKSEEKERQTMCKALKQQYFHSATQLIIKDFQSKLYKTFFSPNNTLKPVITTFPLSFCCFD